MNRVERAVILAAGMGERMYPVTITTPKPLIRVHGRRMIDGLIAALHRNGIFEIYVVVGYLKEKFAGLEESNPGLKLIENQDYAGTNSISSLFAAREHLENAIILDGDQIVYDDAALSPEFMRSGYNAMWTDEPTEEWLLHVEEGVVTGYSRTGGAHGWRRCGISRWTAEDGKKLRRHLEIEYAEKQNRRLLWEDLALFRYPREYSLGIHPMFPDDVIELDHLEELAAVDPGYAGLIAP